VTGTERRRHWREQNPERSRESERVRAQARRDGYWSIRLIGGGPLRELLVCESSDSYARYERTWARVRQRAFYRSLGAGAHRLTPEEFRARNHEVYQQRLAEIALVAEADLIATGIDPDISRPSSQIS